METQSVNELITLISEGLIVTENNLCETIVEKWTGRTLSVSDFKRCKICIRAGKPDSFLLYFGKDFLGTIDREFPFTDDEKGISFRVVTEFKPSPLFTERFPVY